jgi:outer membrane protein W
LKKLSAVIAVLAIMFAVSSSFAQPQITVHVTGGYNLPMPDLKGTWPDDSAKNPQPYYQKSGFNAGADAKYFLGKKRNLGITLSLAYNSFSSGDIAFTGYTVLSKMNMFTTALGVEYSFMPKGKANPFIGVAFSGNFFSGKTTVTPTTGTVTENTLKSASRFGIQGNLGVDVMLNKSIGFVVGAKYDLANLIGKDTTTSTVSTEYTLMDKEYTVGTTTMSAKSISWLSVYAGVSFYFNRPKSMKK